MFAKKRNYIPFFIANGLNAEEKESQNPTWKTQWNSELTP